MNLQADIIIPTYNNGEELLNCLKSLEQQTVQPSTVYVCVDGSTDGTTQRLKRYSSILNVKVLFHPNNENRGRQATRNLAINHSNSPFILFLDSDLMASPSWVEAHLKGLISSSITIGPVEFTDSHHLWTRYYSSRSANQGSQHHDLSVLNYISTNTGFRRDVFEKVGLMDESIKVYGGDIEFSLRLERHFPEIKLGYRSDAKVIGKHGKSIEEASTQYEMMGEVVAPYLMKKYGDHFERLFHPLLFDIVRSRILTPSLLLSLRSYLLDGIINSKGREKVLFAGIRVLLALSYVIGLTKVQYK